MAPCIPHGCMARTILTHSCFIFLPAVLMFYKYVANVRLGARAGSDARTCFGVVSESCCIRNARTPHQAEGRCWFVTRRRSTLHKRFGVSGNRRKNERSN
uniref:Uncharacterized protein n=1 Tax=Onchocerca volvulus TaxID=6282 RepID=A0A8R1XTB1_ONCVO